MAVLDEEKHHRLNLWHSLTAEVQPKLLNDFRIYRGGQGIYVDKDRTAALAPDGSGVAVSLLHTGRHYPDDLSEDGLIYHYPKTNRSGSRDAGEVAATKNAATLKLPVFVILPGSKSQTRTLRLGWVEDWDDDASLFLVLFGEDAPTYHPSAKADDPFLLTDNVPPKKGLVKLRPRQQVFRFQVLAQYGVKCAVCPIQHPSLIKAAHLRGKGERGSDDWRNGLPLCSTHHDAFDAHLFAIHPDTLNIETPSTVVPSQIGLSLSKLAVKRQRPHRDALEWRYKATQSKWKDKQGSA